MLSKVNVFIILVEFCGNSKINVDIASSEYSAANFERSQSVSQIELKLAPNRFHFDIEKSNVKQNEEGDDLIKNIPNKCPLQLLNWLAIDSIRSCPNCFCCEFELFSRS